MAIASYKDSELDLFFCRSSYGISKNLRAIFMPEFVPDFHMMYRNDLMEEPVAEKY